MKLLLNPFVNRFNEGGPFMMTLILICFLVSIFFIFKSALNIKTSNFLKYIDLLKEVSLLGVVLGVFGSLIGLVITFDTISVTDASTSIFAAGLKVALLTLVFGTFTFVVARIAVVILKLMRKDNAITE